MNLFRFIGIEKQDNCYEAVLRWGYQRIDAGVTYDAFEKFTSKLTPPVHKNRQLSLFHELFRQADGNSQNAVIAAREGAVFQLTVEAAFRHLERVELEEARKGSLSAMRIAIASFVLAAVVGGIQIAVAMNGS